MVPALDPSGRRPIDWELDVLDQYWSDVTLRNDEAVPSPKHLEPLSSVSVGFVHCS
jgi:hypothetical protein